MIKEKNVTGSSNVTGVTDVTGQEDTPKLGFALDAEVSSLNFRTIRNMLSVAGSVFNE